MNVQRLPRLASALLGVLGALVAVGWAALYFPLSGDAEGAATLSRRFADLKAEVDSGVLLWAAITAAIVLAFITVV